MAVIQLDSAALDRPDGKFRSPGSSRRERSSQSSTQTLSLRVDESNG